MSNSLRDDLHNYSQGKNVAAHSVDQTHGDSESRKALFKMVPDLFRKHRIKLGFDVVIKCTGIL